MSEKFLIFRGGHRIGNFNVTMPMSILQVSDKTLKIKSLFASAILNLFEVIEIQEVIYFTFLGQGFKIMHNKPQCSKTVIFWSLRAPEKLISEIIQTDFLRKNAP